MISVSLKHLAEAVRGADSFDLPDMNTGTKYIFDNIYNRLVLGETVKLSEINFGNFEYGDLAAMSELHENVFEPSETAVRNITTNLRRIPPALNPVVYI